jgi:transposase
MRGGLAGNGASPIRSEAVALAALRHPDLPVASLDGPAREVKLLSDYRRDLVRQRTQLCNKIRWFLHELNPSLEVPSRGLRRRCVITRVEAELDASTAWSPGWHGASCPLRRVESADRRAGSGAQHLDKGPRADAADRAGLRGVVGGSVGRRDGWGRPVQIRGHLRPVHRHRTHPGLVGQQRRKGPPESWRNRRTNTALYMIAITQSRGHGPGRAYIEKLQARGKTRTEAVRLLRRRISDTVFAALRTDFSHRSASPADSTMVPPNTAIRAAA